MSEPPPVSLDPVAEADLRTLGRLWQLYRHDLSEFRGTLPDAGGRYGIDHLTQYAPGQPDRLSYVARLAQPDRPVGFALVRGIEAGQVRVLGEFFVVRAVRRQGVARGVAEQLLRRHPGTWEIAFQEENPGAARFWRRLAASVDERWQEERRPVPGKPHIPPDVWITLRTPGG